jgi:hypothetical protein
MRFANADSQLIAVAKRTLLSLAAGLIVGFVFGQYITPSPGQRLLVSFVFSAVAYRTQSVAAMGLVPVAAIVISSTLLQSARLSFSFRFDFVLLGAIFFLCGLLIVLGWRTPEEAKLQVVDILLLALLAAILQFLTRQSTWDLREAFAAVSVTGEDNGSWLDGVAGILRRDAAFDSQGIAPYGYAANSLSSLLVGVANSSGFLGGTVADSAIMTMQMYWLLTAIAAFLAARVTYRLASPSVGRSAVGLSVLAAVMTTVFSQGFISGGHLTAQLSATLLLASILLLLEKPFSELATGVLAGLLLLSAADAWLPTRGVMVLVLIGAFIVSAPSLLTNRTWVLRISRDAGSGSAMRSVFLWGVTVFVGLVVLIVVQNVLNLEGRSFPEFFTHVKGLLIVDGGKADVDPLVAIPILLFAVIAAADSALDTAPRKLLGVLLGSCVAFPVLLIAYGFSQPPYAPQYAAYKVLYMVCLVLTPISIAGFTLVVKQVCKSSPFAVIAVAVVAIMGSATYFEPYPRVKNLLVTPPAGFWVDAAIKELAKNPDRLLLCLDTREQWQGQDARACTRQLAGIQGKTNMTPWVWLEVNICRATSAEVAALPEEFWQNVTLLVTDNQRLVSTDECERYGWAGPGLPDDERYPIGALSGVPWNVVRVIGPDGEEVKKSFAYLGGEVPEEVLEKLERDLVG